MSTVGVQGTSGPGFGLRDGFRVQAKKPGRIQKVDPLKGVPIKYP